MDESTEGFQTEEEAGAHTLGWKCKHGRVFAFRADIGLGVDMGRLVITCDDGCWFTIPSTLFPGDPLGLSDPTGAISISDLLDQGDKLVALAATGAPGVPWLSHWYNEERERRRAKGPVQ